MRMNSLSRWSLVATLAGALLASPAAAQGKGKDRDKRDDRSRARPELVRRQNSKAAEKALKREQKLREERLKDEYERREESLKRDRERWEDRRDDGGLLGGVLGGGYDDRYEERREKGPPFCRNGEGHPVHGRRWCEEKGYGLGRDVGIYDDRYDDRAGSRDGYGAYNRQHEDFHLRHDRECRMRAAERPLDLQWQIRIRQECKARHDDWHYRAGRSHG